MKIELDKTYEAKKFEDEIYKTWEESGFFNPDNLKNAKKPYCILMPPPNVTGILHLGHALENSILDTEIRFRRMCGYKALLLPGADHAAVATQARVEKELQKSGIKNPREELGREKLLEKIREYSENSKSTILNQIRKMGTSCDWSRFAYTFDETRSRAVNTLFKKMYEDGLIYKGYRAVNWTVRGQSTCSDDELIYEDEPVTIYTFKYSHDFPIPIATTRPETKLGDTAVAVNPKDDRYNKYIGQKFTVSVGALNPLTITIIADENADINYGTGAVGVTPAHSMVDFEMYQKNKEIGIIPVIGPDGKMTENAGKNYEGLTVLEAREKFVNWLKENNLIIKQEESIHSVGKSDRFNDVIEVIPMKQWFIDVNKIIPGKNKSLKQLMKDVFTTGHNGKNKKIIKITPDRFLNSYMQWIDNLRDWCISRQIWWGHRIPVWYRGDKIFIPKTITELYITRHGITDWNKEGKIQGTTDTPLDEDSISNIELLANKLKNEKIDIIISSTQKRARQTAEIINQKLKIKFETNELLIERNYGDFEGQNLEKVKMKYPEYKKDKINFDIPGEEETYKEVKKRIEEFIKYINKNYSGKKILIITHNAVARAFYMIMKGAKDTEASKYKLQQGEIEKYCILDGNNPKDYKQDPDTLDTWFSSGAWTFSTLGWPDKTKDFKKFHPTQWMQMGYEILFFWMARMILMTTYAIDDIPFEEVYIHGILRSKEGKKFSKSLGNSLDPIEIIQNYGTDALRLSLIKGIAPGNDAKFYEEKVLGARNFINKLWNISRYILMSSDYVKLIKKQPRPITLADEWILRKLNTLIESATKDLKVHNFSMTSEALYDFTWTDFADWYIEISKVEKGKNEILLYILQTLLKLWHPFIPFITETIWKNIDSRLLMISSWPKSNKTKSDVLIEFGKLQEIIIAIRNLKNEHKIDLKTIIDCHIESEKYFELIVNQIGIIESLAKVKLTNEKYKDVVHISDVDIYIEITINEADKQKQIRETIAYINLIEEKLNNKKFTQRAPEHIIDNEKKKLKSAYDLLEKLK
ncbi:MAG: class I tRNA ligase family protein [Patescibacteria group bacterium]|nr:class I tRNA ligase family protein [Patescibacteria group bacterium]